MLTFSTSGVTECFAENVSHEEIPAEETVSGGEINSGEDTEAALESVSGDEPAEDEAAVEPQAESAPAPEIPEDEDAVSDNDLSEDIEELAESVSSDDTTTVSGDVFLPVEEESREPEIVGIFPSSAQRKYLVQIPAAPNNDLTCAVAYTFFDSSSPGKYDLYISSYGSNVPSTGFSNWSYNQSGIRVIEYTEGGPTTETTATLESLLNNTISIIGFSEKIKAIPANAFKNRKALQSVKFEGKTAGSTCQVTSIGASAFMGCTNLQTVDMSATTGLSEILGGFDGCFEGCTALKTVKLNNGLTGIGQNAFRNCSSLTEIDIPSSVTLIGWSAFLNSGLKKVTIRKRTSELSVALGAFNYCNSLSKILFYGTSSDKDTYIKIVADNNSQFLNESIWTYIDPDKMCGDNLTWSIVRSSTDSYYEYTLHISGEGAMYDYADSSQVPWKNAYNKERVCRIIIDEGVTSIGDYAFDYSACRPYETTSGSSQVTRCLSVSIPEGVQKIGKYAFNGQKNLYNIFLPKSVCDIRTGAFKDCANLQGICFWCTDYTLSIGSEAFSGCNRNMYFSFPKRVSYFGENAFKSLNNIKVYCPFGEYVYNNTTYTDDGDVLVKAIRNQGGSGAVYSGNYTGSEGKNKFFQSRYGFVGEVVPSSNGK
ncbi:MAG: leucine-rich repeat protein, partial [Lachnospiraceae bacterium]|nr:leucine-rich repeat protein [Lachnospiraceae bacterium]